MKHLLQQNFPESSIIIDGRMLLAPDADKQLKKMKWKREKKHEDGSITFTLGTASAYHIGQKATIKTNKPTLISFGGMFSENIQLELVENGYTLITHNVVRLSK